MQISILTLFPEMFSGPFDFSILKRAKEKEHLQIKLVNIRNFGIGKHKSVDDTPYGGGTGMVMRVDVLEGAIKKTKKGGKEKTVLLSARGEKYTQKKAREYAGLDSLILISGHYEGVDERVSKYIDEEISVGDFVTTGGEIPAMLVTDSVARLIPGVLKNEATDNETFSLSDGKSSLVEYPQYTKPEEFNGEKVPEVLLSGDHKKIDLWRLEKAKEITKKRRPDLYLKTETD